MKANHVMLVNALVLILLGLYGFMADEGKSLIPLIGPVIGVTLLILSFRVNDNRKFEQAGLAITSVTAIVFLISAIMHINTHIFFMAMVSVVSAMFYMKDLKTKGKVS